MATTTLRPPQDAKHKKSSSVNSKEKSTNSDYMVKINTFDGFGVSDQKMESRSLYKFL